MASKAVRDAVTTKLAADWSSTPVYEMNTYGDVPSDGTSFLVVQYPVSNTIRPPLKQLQFWEEGVFSLVINTQRGFGLEEAMTLADEAAALFRSQRFDGVVTQVPDIAQIGDTNDQGQYFTVSVAVPYQYQFSD